MPVTFKIALAVLGSCSASGASGGKCNTKRPSSSVVGQLIKSECGNLQVSDCCLRCEVLAGCQAADLSSGCCAYYANASGFIKNSSATSVSLFAPTPPASNGSFLPNCEPGSQHGWPSFDSKDALMASPWAIYIRAVYGELPPEDDYPVCTFSFWRIFKDKYDAAGIKDKILVSKRLQPSLHWQEGDFFQKFLRPWIFWARYYNDGTAWIYHKEFRFYPSNSWVEVDHKAGGDTGELQGMWFQYARGSGVWFNLGNTTTFPTHEHARIQLCGNPLAGDSATARCAMEQGLDSYQFGFSYFLGDYFEIVASRLVGKYACGSSAGGTTAGLRAGWKASRACNCDNSKSSLNCDFTFSQPSSDDAEANQLII